MLLQGCGRWNENPYKANRGSRQEYVRSINTRHFLPPDFFFRLCHFQNIIQRQSDLIVIKSLIVFTSVQCSDPYHHNNIAFYRSLCQIAIIWANTFSCFLLSLSKKTRGPWWSYIAHLSKQICILTIEVSAKFTALWFLYNFFQEWHNWPIKWSSNAVYGKQCHFFF